MTSQNDRRFESCRELFAALSEYVDAELAVEKCEEIEAHLAGCEPCVQFVASLKRTIELCRNYESRETPGTLDEKARQELWEACRQALKGRNPDQ